MQLIYDTDNVARCRFFVLQGDGSALLWMPDIELLGILKIMCEVVEDQQAYRKSDPQTMEPTGTLSCRANMDTILIASQTVQISLMVTQTCQIISSPVQTKRQTRKQADYLNKKITAHLIMYPWELDVLKGHSNCRLEGAGAHTRPHSGGQHMHFKNHSGRSWNNCRNSRK